MRGADSSALVWLRIGRAGTIETDLDSRLADTWEVVDPGQSGRRTYRSHHNPKLSGFACEQFPSEFESLPAEHGCLRYLHVSLRVAMPTHEHANRFGSYSPVETNAVGVDAEFVPRDVAPGDRYSLDVRNASHSMTSTAGRRCRPLRAGLQRIIRLFDGHSHRSERRARVHVASLRLLADTAEVPFVTRIDRGRAGQEPPGVGVRVGISDPSRGRR